MENIALYILCPKLIPPPSVFLTWPNFPSRYFHSYSWYQGKELKVPSSLPFHLAHQHISSTALPQAAVSIADAVGEFPDPLAVFYHFSVPVLSVLSTSLCCFCSQWFIPEAFFGELPCPGTLYSWWLGIYITLGWSIASEWLVQKYESLVPLPSNKTNSKMEFMLQSFLWNQVESRTHPESSLLLSLFSFPVLLASPTKWFLLRAMPWEITSHGPLCLQVCC